MPVFSPQIGNKFFRFSNEMCFLHNNSSGSKLSFKQFVCRNSTNEFPYVRLLKKPLKIHIERLLLSFLKFYPVPKQENISVKPKYHISRGFRLPCLCGKIYRCRTKIMRMPYVECIMT